MADHEEIVYWGDIDTHGFAILDRLRSRHPGVTSIMMDSHTLLAHRKQWVREPVPTRRALERLTPNEGALYRGTWWKTATAPPCAWNRSGCAFRFSNRPSSRGRLSGDRFISSRVARSAISNKI